MDKMKHLPKHSLPSFTLVEFLIVIGILAILASVGITTSIKHINEGKIAGAKADMDNIKKAITVAGLKTGGALLTTTGYNCSECPCRDVLWGANSTQRPECAASWNSARTAIETTSGFHGLPERDPWGTPYGLDENEDEYAIDPCRAGTIRSAGPDRLMHGDPSNDLVAGIYDDIIIFLPMVTGQCAN